MIRWILLGCLASGALAQSAAETACGVITSLDGTLTVVDTHGHKAAASLFDWIACNRVLESAPKSHAVVALANGQRFELGSNARLALKPDGAEKITGLVNKLSSLPPMPKLPGIDPEGGSAVRAAAVRLRGPGSIHNLFPKAGFSSLADHTTLRFSPSEDASEYKVELEDETGVTVFQVQTPYSRITVPPGVLKCGVHYYWRVRGIGPLGISQRGEAEFDTMSQDTATNLAAFKAGLPPDDPDALVLLALIDSKLGLLADAQSELQSALEHNPNSDPLRTYLNAIEMQMKEEPGDK